MDSGYTTEIASGQTVSILDGASETGYQIDGTILDAGTLSNAEVGDSGSVSGGTPIHRQRLSRQQSRRRERSSCRRW